MKLAEMIGERLRNMNAEFSKLREEIDSLKSKQRKEAGREKASSSRSKSTAHA
jgi:hypothetical protein